MTETTPVAECVSIRLADVKRAAVRILGIGLEELVSPWRFHARERHLAIAAACAVTARSLPEIGAAFRRDHSTVIYARKNVSRLIRSDPAVAELLARIRVAAMEEALLRSEAERRQFAAGLSPPAAEPSPKPEPRPYDIGEIRPHFGPPLRRPQVIYHQPPRTQKWPSRHHRAGRSST